MTLDYLSEEELSRVASELSSAHGTIEFLANLYLCQPNDQEYAQYTIIKVENMTGEP